MSKKARRRSPASRDTRRAALLAKLMQPPREYLGHPRNVYTAADCVCAEINIRHCPVHSGDSPCR